MTLIITPQKDLIFPTWGKAMEYLSENGYNSLEVSAQGFVAWCGNLYAKIEVLK